MYTVTLPTATRIGHGLIAVLVSFFVGLGYIFMNGIPEDRQAGWVVLFGAAVALIAGCIALHQFLLAFTKSTLEVVGDHIRYRRTVLGLPMAMKDAQADVLRIVLCERGRGKNRIVIPELRAERYTKVVCLLDKHTCADLDAAAAYLAEHTGAEIIDDRDKAEVRPV